MFQYSATTPAVDIARLPPGAGEPKVIVCEKRARWFAALRSDQCGQRLPVVQTASLSECWHRVRQYPASFLVLELAADNVRPLVGGLIDLEQRLPLVRAAVVTDRSLARYEPLVRQAGAVHFVVSPRHMGPLARIAARHLEQAPVPPRSVAEEIWARLPWASAAGS